MNTYVKKKVLRVFLFLIVILASLFFLASTGYGETFAQGYYSGFGMGMSKTETESSIGVKIFGGYQFNERFALEFTPVASSSFISTVSVNNAVTEGTKKTTYETTYQVNSIALTAVVLLPINDRTSLFAKGGLALWKADNITKTTITTTLPTYPDSVFISTSDGVKSSDRGYSPVFGVGAQYINVDDVFLRIEYEKYLSIGDGSRTGRTDIDMLCLSAGVMF